MTNNYFLFTYADDFSNDLKRLLWVSVEVLGILFEVYLILYNCFTEKIFGVKVVITGDTIRRHEKTLVIMNHRTRLDWMFFFCCVFHCRVLNRHKITLKSVLKWIPGAGKLENLLLPSPQRL